MVKVITGDKMNIRTDLALEAKYMNGEEEIEGTRFCSKQMGNGINVYELYVETKEAKDKLNKEIGVYITIETPPLTDNFNPADEKIKIISKEIKKLIPPKDDGLVLVIGLGNLEITPDALGPKTSRRVFATRHIKGELKKITGLTGLRPVSVIAPGVLGQTGIESGEIILSLIQNLKCSSLIIVDALASLSPERLGRTIQISDAGIAPGSGVGNYRPVLNKKTLGIPVISIGVPTVVNAKTLAFSMIKGIDEKNVNIDNSKDMIVTPREIDVLIDRTSLLIGMSINCALQDKLTPEDLFSLTT